MSEGVLAAGPRGDLARAWVGGVPGSLPVDDTVLHRVLSSPAASSPAWCPAPLPPGSSLGPRPRASLRTPLRFSASLPGPPCLPALCELQVSAYNITERGAHFTRTQLSGFSPCDLHVTTAVPGTQVTDMRVPPPTLLLGASGF